jgi:hypothetical protein
MKLTWSVQVRDVSIGGRESSDANDGNTSKALDALSGFAAKLKKVGGADLPLVAP